jgi:hypothetical protein
MPKGTFVAINLRSVPDIIQIPSNRDVWITQYSLANAASTLD